MKWLHLSDLHIGKRVNEFSMMEDQQYILDQILSITEEEQPDGVLIAGDVYDKSQPSAEAVELLDDFLTRLTALRQPVFIISGNHDSPERLGFGNRLFEKNRLYIAGAFHGALKKVSLSDEYGEVHCYLLPFIKPAAANPFLPEPAETYEEAVRAALSTVTLDPAARNVLLAHQFVVNGSQQPIRSDSETVSVGGLDQVDASVFDAFDYVALGHLHGPQAVKRPSLRYAGSPLKYSFSEARQRKGLTFITLRQKGDVSVHTRDLVPLRDLRVIKGPIDALLHAGRQEPTEDYIHATLTDEDELYDALGRLRQVYPNLMSMTLENSRSARQTADPGVQTPMPQADPLDMFRAFYHLQNHVEPTPEQIRIMTDIFEQAQEVER